MNACAALPRRRSQERGAVLIFVTIIALLIIGMVGLAMDRAHVSRTNQLLRNAADAAALNAVRYLNEDGEAPNYAQTRAAAIQVALLNEAAKEDVDIAANVGNDPAGDIVVGYWDMLAHTFTPTLTAPNAVRIRANRNAANVDGPLALFFGPVFGANQSNVGVLSTAVLAPPLLPLILILDPYSKGALHNNGNNYLDVTAGKIHVNSNHNCGVDLIGTPEVFSPQVSVVGGACYTEDMVLDPNGDPKPVVEGADLIPDPLAHLLPTVADWDAFRSGLTPQPGSDGAGTITDTGAYPPGYYPGGIVAESDAQISLQNGYYMIGGSELTLKGNAFVTATNVTIFLDKDVGMDVAGSGAGMLLTPPGPGDTYHGISLFSHREPSKNLEFKINGGGAFDVLGIAYFPGYVPPYPPSPGEVNFDSVVRMGGQPGKTFGAIIAWQIAVNGVTGYTITGNGLPPIDTGEPPVAFLVE